MSAPTFSADMSALYKAFTDLADARKEKRISVALEDMNSALVAALEAAKDAEVPQGLIVALLHGHAHQQTSMMMENT